jgi:hypothetical protein
MADDSALIWDSPKPVRPRRRSQKAAPQAAAPAPGALPPADDLTERISLREAEHRFGTKVGTLRGWARKGTIDGVMAEGTYGKQWMVTPESIAHHLSRTTRERTEQERRRDRPATGPTDDGTAMLVPRDAWDRLMDQLGNLHDAGLQLAEARERAAKAETEATFLRDRLAEMRHERDEARVMAEEAGVRERGAATSQPAPPSSLRRAWGRLFGRG